MAETEVKLRALKNTESISEEVLSADSDSTSLVDERWRVRKKHVVGLAAQWLPFRLNGT